MIDVIKLRPARSLKAASLSELSSLTAKICACAGRIEAAVYES